MHQVRRELEVPYTASQMFMLINDVRAYPKFLPWCGDVNVLVESKDLVVASLQLKKGALRKSFTTRNRLYPHHEIRLELVEGPFRSLHGEWLFNDRIDGGCRISFQLQFQFASKLLESMLNPVFSNISHTLIEAFSARAAQVYGNATGS